MIIHEEIEQGTPEWHDLRRGKLTASHATSIGNCGKGLDTYCVEKVAERLSCGELEHYSNRHTDRGNEYEPMAATMYELETGNTTKEVAFAEYNDYVGCSPDRLCNEDGLIEIKCPDDKGFLYALLGADIKSEYKWQMQMQMLITGRKWCDFVQFNPNFKKSMLIRRVYPDKEKQDKLLEGFKLGEQKIKEIEEKVNAVQ